MFSIGDESWAVLVWSYIPVSPATFIGNPDHGNAIDHPGVHMINIQHSACACSLVEVRTTNQQRRVLMKVTTMQEIQTIDVNSAISWFVGNLNARKLRAFIVICNRGKWLPDSDTNSLL